MTPAETESERQGPEFMDCVREVVMQKTESERSLSDRELARKRVERKHKFRGDVVAYVVINIFLVGVWALTDRGYFWPGWVLAGWAVFLLLDGWTVYFRRPVTNEEIDRELKSSAR